MGVAFYPVIEDGSGGWTSEINGKLLAKAHDRLERVAKRQGVPSLVHFFSPSREEAILAIGGDPEDPDSFDVVDLPEEMWFSPTEGLRSVRVMLDHVRRNPRDFDRAGEVIEDLEVFERLLTDAERKGTRWHSGIDF